MIHQSSVIHSQITFQSWKLIVQLLLQSKNFPSTQDVEHKTYQVHPKTLFHNEEWGHPLQFAFLWLRDILDLFVQSVVSEGYKLELNLFPSLFLASQG